jgi:hypothetical protein
MKTPVENVWESMRVVDLHPSLEEVVLADRLDRKKLSVALKMAGNKADVTAREEVIVTDGLNDALWRVSSLRALLRGDQSPPAFGDEPPPAYVPHFFFIEKHVLTFCDGLGDKTDGEFEDAYSNLRRRPDGKSFSDLHFFLWQVAAALVGIRPVSAAEFEAIFGRLARSASHFRWGEASRNYMGALRRTIGQA